MDKYEARQKRRQGRLRNRSDIEQVREKGAKVVGRYCVMHALSVAKDEDKMSIVVSRHFSKKAVIRNRARRILREAWRQIEDKPEGCWVLLRPRKKIMNARTDVVIRELQELLLQAGLKAEHPEPSPETGRT